VLLAFALELVLRWPVDLPLALLPLRLAVARPFDPARPLEAARLLDAGRLLAFDPPALDLPAAVRFAPVVALLDCPFSWAIALLLVLVEYYPRCESYTRKSARLKCACG